MSKKAYKSNKKYACPYCEVKLNRMDLITHVESKHEALIPANYSATRVVYDSINKTDHGTCMICKKPVYEWNEKISRYNNLCGSDKCRAEVRRIALERHIKTYNTPTLLNDPEHQEKMLANRRISGRYNHSDGGKFTYTGKYEKAAIEFMDKVMNIPSKDIQMPGPILEYNFRGEKHRWITDIYYIPANLIIEVKDGGDNPNNRNMPDYRAKQVAKEEMVTELGTFNYLRLTNNNFAQLLEVLAEIKYENMDQSEAPKVVLNINESSKFEFLKESISEYSTPQKLSLWMKKNIKYKHTGKFLSSKDVEINKYGDCHDQSLFEYEKIKDMGYKCGRLFMVEYSNWNSPGGATHTICYYIDDNQFYWFENAWADKAGIHGPYTSLDDLKKDIANNWQWSGKNNKLYMSKLGNVKPGMTLEEYIVACTPKDEPKPFATKNGKSRISHSINESIELAFNESDVPYINISEKEKEDTKKIIDSLDKKQRKYLGDDYFVDVYNFLYLDIKYIDKKPAGFVAIVGMTEGPHGFIMFAVDPKYQGKGIASELISDMMDICKNDLKIDTLTWNVNFDNKTSEHLAKKFGFTFYKKYGTYNEYDYDFRNHKGKLNKFTEEVGGIPPHRPNRPVIVPCMMSNTFTAGITDEELDDVFIKDETGTFNKMPYPEFIKSQPNDGVVLIMNNPYTSIYEAVKKEPKSVLEFVSILTGRKLRSLDELYLDNSLSKYDRSMNEYSPVIFRLRGLFAENEITSGSCKRIGIDRIIKGAVMLGQSEKGYYVYTPNDYSLSSNYYESPEAIPQNVIDTMADLYDQHKKREEITNE